MNIALAFALPSPPVGDVPPAEPPGAGDAFQRLLNVQLPAPIAASPIAPVTPTPDADAIEVPEAPVLIAPAGATPIAFARDNRAAAPMSAVRSDSEAPLTLAFAANIAVPAEENAAFSPALPAVAVASNANAAPEREAVTAPDPVVESDIAVPVPVLNAPAAAIVATVPVLTAETAAPSASGNNVAAAATARTSPATAPSASAAGNAPADQPPAATPAAAPTALAVAGPVQPHAAQAQVQAAPLPQPTETMLAVRPDRLAADVAVEVVRQIGAGRSEFTIRLDPPDLGRIDVSLEFRGNEVRAVVSTDNPATHDLLRRDADAFQRLFADSGFRADGQTLRFDLRDGSGGRQHAGDAHRAGTGNAGAAEQNLADAPRASRRGLVDLVA